MNVVVNISKRLDCMNTDTSNMLQAISQKLSDTAETASTPKALLPKDSPFVSVINR